MARLDIDYAAAKPRAGALGWLLLLLGVATLGSVLAYGWRLSDELVRTERASAQVERQIDGRRASRTPTRFSPEEMKRAHAVITRLTLPWEQIFGAIEQSDARAIGLLALAALTGPGLSTGGWRFGGTARASLRHPSFVLWPTLSGWYTSQPIDDDGLAVSWFGVGAGLVLGRDWQALDLSGRLRGEGMIERLAIEQTRAPVDHGSRWVPGLKLGADATWPASGPVGAIIGGDLDLYQNETVVRVAGTDVARAGARNYSLLLGVELRLP